MEASYGWEGDEARLISSLYKKSADTCTLDLWSYLYGEHIGSLLVYVHPAGAEKILVFNETGDHGQGWKQFPVTIGAHNNFQVSVVAVMGQSYKGDIAVDDLKFRGCALTAGLPSPSLPRTPQGL